MGSDRFGQRVAISGIGQSTDWPPDCWASVGVADPHRNTAPSAAVTDDFVANLLLTRW